MTSAPQPRELDNALNSPRFRKIVVYVAVSTLLALLVLAVIGYCDPALVAGQGD